MFYLSFLCINPVYFERITYDISINNIFRLFTRNSIKTLDIQKELNLKLFGFKRER